MIRIALAALFALLLAAGAHAQPAAAPPPPGGPEAAPHFSMQPVEGGVLRLDTRSGAMSFCGSRGGVWRCEALPDERATLEAEIARLRDRLASTGGGGVPDIAGPPRQPPSVDATPPAPDATPPAKPDEERGRFDAAMEEAMRKAEAMFRRFYEMMERLRSNPPQGEKL
ncbi:hypothetical protein LGR54_18750 [Ancylobacter sp. Lp-2]|uniref:hypothetical protein n=1 Tax=Ancylobacter sp. Lp-2 TaxID=2881339 RepID=UPI001E61CE96|nr:hypothetical protein [Ancylobacter sp. Lp-2]MCB4770652.1 hypothetical protein [Ancylobacter sp. Lp-2]